MDTLPAAPHGAAAREAGHTRLLWGAATAVAALGSVVLFDALPGIGWLLWVAAAVAGLVAIVQRRRRPPRFLLCLGAAPVVVAGAAATTASPRLSALICLAVIVLLAIVMLLTPSTSLRGLTPRLALLAAPTALARALAETVRRGHDATLRIGSPGVRGWVRGLAITLPVLVAFALLLAGADPVFAAWRDAAGQLLGDWTILPRLVFFAALLALVLGAYGHALAGEPPRPEGPPHTPLRWFGATERGMLLGGVAGLLWLFLAVQVGYLFGTHPAAGAAGLTFADYARRGFGELTVVASATGVLIVVSERHGEQGVGGRLLRALTLAVIAAVLFLLGSALRRVWLYEEAYGFTTARLYAQVYMAAVAAGLLLLVREVAGRFDEGRLFRRAAALVGLLFVALLYWNHEGWIARRNIERFASTGRLDVGYLARGLSLDALPAIADGLPTLPEPTRSELRGAVRARYAQLGARRHRAWYEWNLARERGWRALDARFAER